MRKAWTDTTLGLLVSLETGKLDVNAAVEGGEFPFFTCSRETYTIDIAAYSGKSVIVAGNGDLNVKYYEGEFNAYQRTYILQAINESIMNPIFLFHFMDKYVETLRRDTQGSTIQYLKKAQFTEAPVALPPLAEQRRIVDIASSVDAYIDALQQQADTARTARNAVLHELLFAGGDDWTGTTLGDVAEWFSGGTPKAGKSEFYENGTIPWVVITDMMKTEIFDTASKITKAGLAEIGGRVAPKDSVLISMYATVGRPGFAHIPVATNQAIAWSIPNEKMIKPRFLLLVAQFLESEISSMARGATQRNINRAMLKEFSFSLPPLDEQKRIVEIVSSMDGVIQSTEKAVVGCL